MGAIWSYFMGKDPKKPIKGCRPRIVNIFTRHHRGLVGTFVPLLGLPWLLKKNDHAKTVKVMWMWMFWFFLLQPVNIPVTGLIPLFMLPMGGAMSSDSTCGCYMNEGIAMFILANMVLLLWNNSGLDRRIMLWFLCSGDTSQCSAKRLVFKCCIASFFLSIFSNKLIVSNIMMQYITPIMKDLQAATNRANEPNFDEVRNILNNAIQTTCCIGGLVMVHSSYATLAFRTIFQTTTFKKEADWHDIFNYIEYTSFALPTAIVMLILNCAYHILLIHFKAGKQMSVTTMTKVRTTLWYHKKDIPSKITLHEKLTLGFSILVLIVYFARWTKYFKGWANSFSVVSDVPGVRDATVAAMFVIFLHSLPSGFRFVKLWVTKKKSEYGKAKPESGILWWRFVDKNITYGYLFLIGSGCALSASIRETKLGETVEKSSLGKIFNGQGKMLYLLLVSLVSVILANIMSSVAAIVIFLPFVMNLFPMPTAEEAPAPPPERTGGLVLRASEPNLEKIYLGALAVGIGASFGFVNPFLYTPAYFCHFTGKVSRKKMATYGVGSALICFLVLWVFISFYAPILWNASAIKQEVVRTTPPPKGAETPVPAPPPP